MRIAPLIAPLVAPLVAATVLVLAVPASAAEPVTPEKLAEVRQLALAAQQAAATPAPEKTPEQMAAVKEATKSSCEGFFARVKERGVEVPGGCE